MYRVIQFLHGVKVIRFASNHSIGVSRQKICVGLGDFMIWPNVVSSVKAYLIIELRFNDIYATKGRIVKVHFTVSWLYSSNNVYVLNRCSQDIFGRDINSRNDQANFT